MVNMNEEIWMPITGYEGLYEVSNYGRVKSLARTCATRGGGRKPIRERIIKQCVIKGYCNVILCRGGSSHKHGLVHRLVAQAFIPNPESKPNIDHIDCDSTNNRADNLRWCTQKENCNNPISRSRNSAQKVGGKNPQYGKRNEEIANARKVACFSRDGEFIATYPSVAEASRVTGVGAQNIAICANGTRRYDKRSKKYYTSKSAGGYIWRYL